MNLHVDNESYQIVSSDDILLTGKNFGKNLTNVLDKQSSDINDLEQYVKWLYKYGGTGSKGGLGGSDGSGSSGDYVANVETRFCNILVQNESSLILGENLINPKSAPLSITILNPKITCKYTIRDLTIITPVNSDTRSIANKSLTIDNNFSVSNNINIEKSNKGQIRFILQYYSESEGIFGNKPIVINYVKDAYSFNLSIVNNDNNNLFINNDSIFYTNALNNGVNLKIDYSLETEAQLKVVCHTPGILSNNEFVINSEDRYEGSYNVPFNSKFNSNTDDIIGSYALQLSYYSDNVRIKQEVFEFTIVPQGEVFLKIVPTNGQIYKYNSTLNQSIKDSYSEYEHYYSYFNKVSSNTALTEEEISDICKYFKIDDSELNSKTELDKVQNILYEEFLNYKFYVFPIGNINFFITPYMSSEYTDVDISCSFAKLDDYPNLSPVNLQYTRIRAEHKNKVMSLNCPESGVYVFNVKTRVTPDNHIITYYFYVYDKDSTINWYESSVLQVFNQTDVNNVGYKNMLNYYRSGDVTPVFEKYKNLQYIQQYSTADDLTLCKINTSLITEQGLMSDCVIQLGIQYSNVNSNSKDITSDQPIITINSTDESNKYKIDVYQDGVKINGNTATLFLPKESDYNASNNDNYHLISIYKRYIYDNITSYYEFCVYLDGTLEGYVGSFLSGRSVWNSIILHKGNYAINLAEITYFPHDSNSTTRETGNLTYLDDISVSEYYYKYVNNTFNDKSLVVTYEAVKKLINQLRSFYETDYGMIKIDSNTVIEDISKELNIPILVFDYNEDKTNRGYFVRSFLQTYNQEAANVRWDLQNIYYSPGLEKIDFGQPIAIDGNNGTWYIEIQGSSTKLYFVKNLTLGLLANDSGFIYLFTPNFKYTTNQNELLEAKDTFLPEQSFTLKADLVDSSHSNNTSIGNFVNKNTKKFDIKFSEKTDYDPYIKNCLLGFPVLIFIRVNSYDENDNLLQDIYFLGIYNFNLGRNSYFNMGYYEPKLLTNKTDIPGGAHADEILKKCDGNTFTTIKYELSNRDDTELQISDGVIVAEIQGNSNYFDFSQYDDSILVPMNENDKGAMFGDFVPKYRYGSIQSDNKTLWHLRRLTENISKGGGYIFEKILKKHLGEHKYAYSKYIDDGIYTSIFASANQVPNYKIQFKRDINHTSVIDVDNKSNNRSNATYKVVDKSDIINTFDNNNLTYNDTNLKNNLSNLVLDQEDVSESDSVREAILDYISLSEYYTICMAFGLTDSVMKNLNVKTWNATYNTNYNEGLVHNNIHGKWFIAFYDMDTAFGRSNDGIYMNNSYFSFSDYWVSNENTLSPVTVYRDFYPNVDINNEYTKNQKIKITGYDTPSSYLFAVAKYAPLAYEDAGVTLPTGSNFKTEHCNFKMYAPPTIWTKYRLNKSSASGTDYENQTGIGELINAKYFINEYFSKKLNNIPEQLWNMNYRFKYLKRLESSSTSIYGFKQSTGQNSSFVGKEYQTFHGKGINQTEDWLNYRFHILDAYFHVDNIPSVIKYLNYKNNEYEINELTDDNGDNIGYTWEDKSVVDVNTNNTNRYKWTNTGYYDVMPVKPNLLISNDDVKILRDIFTDNVEGGRYKYVDLKVKALPYSPLTVGDWASADKYLLINPDIYYSFSKTQTTSDNLKFGGSELWTSIADASTLIQGKKLYIGSNKIQDLVLTSGICNEYNISNMKSLKVVNITKLSNDTTSKFTGDLTFDASNGTDNYPDLTSIKLDRTEIKLKVINEGVQDIIYTNNSNGILEVVDCSNIKNINISGSSISICTITPAWTNNISLNNTKIKKLKISPKNTDDIKREFNINNDSSLESIELSGFTHIVLNKCPRLKDITITNADLLESLQIISCNERTASEDVNESLIHIKFVLTNNQIIESTNGKIDLRKLSKLNILSFEGTKGITSVDVSGLGKQYKDTKYHGITLLEGAFAGTDLQEIITSNDDNEALFITGSRTFSNTGYTYGDNILYITDKCTSLGGMFEYTNMNISSNLIVNAGKMDNIRVACILGNASVADYKPTIYEDITKITDLANMFYGRTDIYVSSDLTSDYKTSLKQLSLKNFSNVNNISYIYGFCAINTIDSSIFTDGIKCLGSDDSVEAIDISMFIKTGDVNCELHTFKPIMHKISKMIANNSTSVSTNLKIFNDGYDYDPNIPIKFADFFETIEPNTQLKKLVSLSGLDINNIVDWDDAFIVYEDNDHNKPISRIPNIKSIENSFNISSGNYNLDNWGLKLVKKKIDIIDRSFNLNLVTPVDYHNILDLSIEEYNGILPMINTNSFNMKKYILPNELITVLKNANNHGVTDLSKQFSNLIIIIDKNNSNSNVLRTHDATVKQAYKFTKANEIFINLSMRYEIDGNDVPITLDSESLKYFTNCVSWDYAFNGVTLSCNLPLNLFNRKNSTGDYVSNNYKNGQPITSLKGTFSNVKIKGTETYFKHENYPEICNGSELNPKYNNGESLEGSYHQTIMISNLISGSNVEVGVDNPRSKNGLFDDNGNIKDHNNDNYGINLRNHLILPFDIFFGCSSSCNLQECFDSSDFEGILPSKLFEVCQLSSINKIFNNLLVIPNRIYNKYGEDYIYNETNLLNKISASPGFNEKYISLLRINQSYDHDGNPISSNTNLLGNDYPCLYQRHKTYLFIPRNFFNKNNDKQELIDAFTFKVILPKSSTSPTLNDNGNVHNGEAEYYFIFSDSSISKSLAKLERSLPGINQGLSGKSGDELTNELPFINTSSIYNNMNEVPDKLNSRTYHNIHYSIMLRESVIDDYSQNIEYDSKYINNNVGKDAEELTKAITYKIMSNSSRDDNGELKYNIEDILKYGITYKHYGIPLTATLKRPSLLSHFASSFIMRYVFGHIFNIGDDGNATLGLNIYDENGSYIFESIEEISRYAALPMIQEDYPKLMSINMGPGFVINLSYFNTQGSTSYEKYTNLNNYSTLYSNLFALDNN